MPKFFGSTILALAILFPLGNGAPSANAQEISFNRDVRQILSDRCFHCHGPDADNQDSDYRLDTKEHAYDAIEPGDLDGSELHHRIRMDEEGRMPPADSTRQLTEKEKDTLDAWIKAGAPFDEHWAFLPIPKKVDVPKAQSKDWPRNAIDQFILSGLTDNKIQPNRESPRNNWLRKVTFDLTGLPPTLSELDSFLTDKSETAFEKVVDRLLASDACAERLTSEWLDVARYADTLGYQRDNDRLVWPYRDWVLGAFKKNMPYDEFVTWQLAGDLMENPTRDQIVATVFNRLHSHKKEGGVALEEFRVENVADRTHTFGAAFMGLTLECARCHDHKYDPTKMKEYYQLSSFFANIDERGLISYFTDAVPTPAAPLPSPEQKQELLQAEQEIVAAEKALATIARDSSNDFKSFVQSLKSSDEPTKAEDLTTGLKAKLSFEELKQLPKLQSGHYKNEEDKKIDADEILGLRNDVVVASESQTEIENADPQKNPWTGAGNRLVDGKAGKAIALTGDDAVVLPGVGHFGRHQPFSISLWIKPGETDQRAVIFRRSRGWDDAGSIGYELTKLDGRLSAKMVHFWPGNAICVETDEVLETGKWHHVVFTYDGSSSAAGLKIYLDGVDAAKNVIQDHLTRTITQWREGYYDLAIGARYRDRGFKGGQVDEFLVYDRQLPSIEVRQLFDGESLQAVIDRVQSNEKLNANQMEDLREFFLATASSQAVEALHALTKKRKKWNEIMDATPAISIMREQPKPRPAYMLTRGVYDQRGEQVTAETPAFMPNFPDNAPRNRLGLAKWITSPDHPLLARVTANRYWQMIFDRGLVRTPEDFGIQGEVPTHPELLDWLSRDFIENGWDVKRMLRMMVLSATYRQSAIVSKLVRDKDPENKWLGRGSGKRLSAEMIRDNCLAVSGLLNSKVGGPPVKPYDVALAYNALPVDVGDKLHRRSLYTYWKRTSPAPVMMAMNASKREVCRLRREVTDSPLQALVLLNGDQFVEASRVLGAKLLQKFDGDLKQTVDEAFRLFTGRTPTDRESSILQELYRQQLKIFETDPDRAEKLLAVGDAVTPKNLPNSEVAAAAVLINSMMNLNESIQLK
jgi:mono/diheme cytochrome c family protein